MLARQVRFGFCGKGTTSIRVVSEARRAMRLHEYSVFARFRYNDLKGRHLVRKSSTEEMRVYEDLSEVAQSRLASLHNLMTSSLLGL
jgi:hypothetical protein